MRPDGVLPKPPPFASMTIRDFSRRAGHVFQAIFGLPFLGFGIFAIVMAVRIALAPESAGGAPKAVLFFLLPFGLVFAGVGGALTVGNLRKAFGPPPPEPPDSDGRDVDTDAGADGIAFPVALPKAKSGSRAAATLLPVILGLVFAAAGVAMLTFGVMTVRRVLDARSWVATPCSIERSEVTSHRGSKGGATYAVAVRFSYRHAGVAHTSDTYSFEQSGSSGYEGKAAVVRGLPPGATTVCYVNPSQPSLAVIDRSMPLGAWIFLGMGGVFSSVGVGLMSAPLFSRRQREREAASGPAGAELVPETTRGAKLVGLAFFALFWNGITSVFVTFAVKSVTANRPEWFLIVFITPFMLVGLGLLGALVLAVLALFKPRLRLTPVCTARAGAALRIKWDAGGRESALRGLRISLEGLEYATVVRRTGKGSQGTRRESVFYRATLLDTEGRPARPGTVAGEIPPALPHSLEIGPDAGILWRIRVRVKTGGTPAIEETYVLRVSPAAPVINPFSEKTA